jgi:hypothetical protein
MPTEPRRILMEIEEDTIGGEGFEKTREHESKVT